MVDELRAALAEDHVVVRYPTKIDLDIGDVKPDRFTVLHIGLGGILRALSDRTLNLERVVAIPGRLLAFRG